MTPTRKQLLSILAKCTNVPAIGGDAFGISKKELLLTCLMEEDLLNLSSTVYDGYDKEHGQYIFLKSGLEKFLDTTKVRAEMLENEGVLAR